MEKKLLIALLFTALMACEAKKEVQEEPDIEALRADVKPTEVVTALARQGLFEFRINSSGTLASEKELTITFQSSGYLEKLYVQNGEKVKVGQVLAELQNTTEKINLEKANLAYEKAYINFQDDSMGRSNPNEQMMRTLQVKSGLTDAELGLREAQNALEKTIIRSPLNGTVAEMQESEGNIVSSGNELCLVYDQTSLVLTGKILESDFRHMKIGLKADIYPLAFKEKVYSGTLVEVNPKVDDNGMVQIKLRVDDPKDLLPGMNTNAIIRVPQQENIIVPRDAMVMKSGRAVVFTHVNGLAKWNYVEVGLDNGVELEVTDGLNAGDEVIITNNLQLAHEAQISVAAPLNSDN